MEGIWTTEELIDSLRKTPVLLAALLVGVDDELARARPGENEWSTVEVIGHLIDAEERALQRIDRVLQEDNPELPGYDQNALVREHGYQRRPLRAVVDRLLELRAERLEVLSALTEEQWLRTGISAGRGATPLTAITCHMCWHDTNHLAQIANNLAAAR
ncbi:MAG TPA: DinB family protein [Thermomicrobiales bacterium]|nr:DinB family protein [Thermomicrobiales bacterium]